jgi:hypothetical protein
MKTYILSLFIIVSAISSKEQVLKTDTSSADSSKPVEREFKNQGEQEDYWAEQLFKKDYKKQKFEKFSGQIIITNRDTYRYGDKVLNVYNTSAELRSIFEKGIFYPEIITGNTKSETKSKQQLGTMTANEKFFYNLSRADSLTITDFEELKFLSKTPQQKRFRFWLFRKGFANPITYFIELTNENATSATGIATFINGSTLTFFKEGWIII